MTDLQEESDMIQGWAPIEDYDPRDKLAHRELAALAEVWSEQRERLADQEAFVEFEQRLKREWAIETGLVERLYSFDRGVTQLLIEHGIQATLIPSGSVPNPEATVAMIADHEAAVEGVFQFVKDERRLSTSYIKELHALMTQHQDTVDGVDSLGRKRKVRLIRGDYKRQPNNPYTPDGSIHEYCPPEHVAAEMDRLVGMHHDHTGVATEVEAAWLHHRFTQIHPFQDGNGRIARAIATIVFVKAGWFPLVVRDRDRARYIDTLQDADSGNLKPLVDYFARLQKDEFVRALGIASDVIEAHRVRDAIRSMRQSLQARRDALIAEWEAAKSIAAKLRDIAQDRLSEVAHELDREVFDLLKRGECFADGAIDGSARSHFYRYQIIATAKQLGYFAGTQSYRSWARLVVRNSTQTELLVAFHGIGHQFQGVLACSATWFQRVETDEGEREIGPVTPVADEVFQINYKEALADTKARFADWLEDAILRGLKLWQDTSL